jgi:hypothetical protein
LEWYLELDVEVELERGLRDVATEPEGVMKTGLSAFWSSNVGLAATLGSGKRPLEDVTTKLLRLELEVLFSIVVAVGVVTERRLETEGSSSICVCDVSPEVVAVAGST